MLKHFILALNILFVLSFNLMITAHPAQAQEVTNQSKPYRIYKGVQPITATAALQTVVILDHELKKVDVVVQVAEFDQIKRRAQFTLNNFEVTDTTVRVAIPFRQTDLQIGEPGQSVMLHLTAANIQDATTWNLTIETKGVQGPTQIGVDQVIDPYQATCERACYLYAPPGERSSCLLGCVLNSIFK